MGLYSMYNQYRKKKVMKKKKAAQDAYYEEEFNSVYVFNNVMFNFNMYINANNSDDCKESEAYAGMILGLGRTPAGKGLTPHQPLAETQPGLEGTAALLVAHQERVDHRQDDENEDGGDGEAKNQGAGEGRPETAPPDRQRRHAADGGNAGQHHRPKTTLPRLQEGLVHPHAPHPLEIVGVVGEHDRVVDQDAAQGGDRTFPQWLSFFDALKALGKHFEPGSEE